VDRRPAATLTCHALAGARSQRLVVAGDIDIATVGALTRFLQARISAAAAGDRLQVDLRGVQVCAAVGVRALVAAAREARERGMVLVYRPHSPAVALALDICGHLELTDPGDIRPGHRLD
jgi:anti-anti-sigma factor